MKFPKPSLPPPAITAAQRSIVDSLLLEDFGLSPLQLQENAGLALAEVAREDFLKGNVRDKGVVVLAGSGMKGGTALACARRLHTWGARVRVCHSQIPAQGSSFTQAQMFTLARMGVVSIEQPAQGAALVIDGLLDYDNTQAITGRTWELIQWANQQIQPLLALDIPSGLQPDTGAHDPEKCVRASATLALGLPLGGLLTAKARPMVGAIYLADISVPRTLYAAPGLNIELGNHFAESGILKLR